MYQIFLQILSGNCLAHTATLNDLCDLKNKVKVMGFKHYWSLCNICGETLPNISSDIERNNFVTLKNKVKVTGFELGLHRDLVLSCTKLGEDMSTVSLDIERKPSCIYCHLKCLCDLESKVKVTMFELDGLYRICQPIRCQLSNLICIDQPAKKIEARYFMVTSPVKDSSS